MRYLFMVLILTGCQTYSRSEVIKVNQCFADKIIEGWWDTIGESVDQSPEYAVQSSVELINYKWRDNYENEIRECLK